MGELPIIIVTGGLGFIGSHIVVELLEQNAGIPIIIDNLSNSKVEVLDKIEKLTGLRSSSEDIRTIYRPLFFQVDLCCYEDLSDIFELLKKKYKKIDAVIHLAGLKAVNESIKMPIEYYHNNLTSTLNLIRAMKEAEVYNLIFSSSATVYGSKSVELGCQGLTESEQIGQGITNPYGMTKYMIELMLRDLKAADKDENMWKIISLRYFNPIGAHPSGLIGEDPLGIPNNLMPMILNSIKEKKILRIFGVDYETCDGTCVRDYIHVVDLAKAHLAALLSFTQQGSQNNDTYRVYNIGTGKGTSVLELIKTFKQVNGEQPLAKIAERREGDIPSVFCNPKLAASELGWTARKNVEDMCRDAWNFFNLNSQQQ